MRLPTIAAVLLVTALRALAQHPAAVTIEDFEDEPTWAGVQLDDTDAKQGKYSGLWIPKQHATLRTTDFPHDWTDFDRLCIWMHSEQANGQRLTLVANSENEADDTGWDYYYYHFTVDWSGWKLLSLRKGVEIRPTRKPLGWHQIDYLSLNTSGWQHHPLEDTVLRLDGVMLVRDPVGVQLIERSSTVDEDRALVRYDFAITNRTDEARSFPLAVEGEFSLFQPHLPGPETGAIAPGEAATVSVVLQASAQALAGAEPLTREAGALCVDPGIEGLPRLEAPIAAAVPLPESDPPLLFASAQEIERAKRRAQKYDWARKQLESIISGGEKALALEVKVPDEGGQWGHHYVCKNCGVGLKTESPTRHVCPRCGKMYTGWPYDQVYVARLHHRLTRAIYDLGLAYAFTGEASYAEKAREILLAYGDKYRSFPLHNVRGEESRSAGRLYAQTLDESVDIIRVAWGYDLVYDSGVFTAEDRQIIEDGYLRAVAEVIRRNDAGKSNWQSWHNAGLAAIGFCLRDEELASLAINGVHGLRYQLQVSVLPDGFWYEGTAAYHFYALDALRWTVEAAYHSGIDLYDDPAYKSLHDAPLLYVFPNLTFPAVNDSDVFSLAGRHSLYELAHARLSDDRYLSVAERGNRGSLEAFLWGADELPPAPLVELPSKDFAGLGAAVLRAGAGEDQVYLHLDYGAHGGGHGHPDKLTMILYALDRELAPDAGRLAYGAPLHRSWYRQTVAHNTVCVDARSQQAAEGRLTLFHDGEAVKIVRAECDTAYAGVMLRRTIALADGYLLDVFEVSSDEEHTYDWLYHNIGELSPGPPTRLVDGLLGEEHGYQHISDLTVAEGGDAWHADFAVPDVGGVRLTTLGESGTEVYFGTGFLGRKVEPCPMVAVRRRCTATRYISTVEWRREGDAPRVQSLELVPVNIAGRQASAEEALGVKVQRVDGSDLLMLAPGALGEKQADGVTTDADVFFVSRRDGDIVGIEHIEIPD